jgi:hypothetical protein
LLGRREEKGLTAKEVAFSGEPSGIESLSILMPGIDLKSYCCNSWGMTWSCWQCVPMLLPMAFGYLNQPR